MELPPFDADQVDQGHVEQIDDGDTIWRFDRAFLESNWTCIWGRGCLGILDEPAEHLGQGCCSVGAELGDEDEARMISALAAMVDPEQLRAPRATRPRACSPRT